MVVLGITPGVRSLAYCVLARAPQAPEPTLVDSDLLKGGRPKPSDNDKDLKRKAKPHILTLDVVLKRAFDIPPKGQKVVMAIGPGSGKEPPELVFLVRAVLTGLAVELGELGMHIECINWYTTKELDVLLGTSFKRAVRDCLSKYAPILRSPYLVAAGTALAAFEQLNKTAPA